MAARERCDERLAMDLEGRNLFRRFFTVQPRQQSTARAIASSQRTGRLSKVPDRRREAAT
jgi:hypothetical protein